MTGRLPVLAFAAAALLAAPSLPASSLAAQDPYRVLIPDFFAKDGQDRGFGEGAANELRDLIDGMPGFEPIERGAIQDEVRKYEMRMQDLDCVKAKQLASLIGNVKLVFCANYSSQGENRVIDGIEVWDTQDTAPFPIEGFTVARGERAPAAQRIQQAFDKFTQGLRATSFCQDYFDSNDWEQALRNCEQALTLNPNAIGTLFLKAEILRQMNRLEESLNTVAQVIAADPLNEDALQMGGFLATQLNRAQQARGYYQQYLDLNPGDVAVRQRIAGEIAEAGDPEGAMIFIEGGLTVAPTNESLLLAHGSYAFAAAAKASQAQQVENSAGLTPQVQGLYRKAIDTFQKLYQEKGAQLEVDYVWNIVKAQMMLQDFSGAITSAEDFMRVHPQHAGLLFDYYVSLERANRTDDAIAALRKLETLDPSNTEVPFRLGLALLNQDKLEEAIPILARAVTPTRTADQLSDQIFAKANEKGFQTRNWGEAVRYLNAAKDLPITANQRGKLDFYIALAHLQRGAGMIDVNAPTIEAVCRTRPIFTEAQRFAEASRAWASATGGQAQAQHAEAASALTQLLDFEARFIRDAEAVGTRCP
jgi:tetratricopeptide (TPR) repeat protein